MTIQTWTAFVVAAGIILIVPGPTVIAVISHALTQGRKAVVPLMIGVVLGDFTALALSLLGLGAVFTASARLYFGIKLLGAIYLIFLGYRLWRINPENGGARASMNMVSRKDMVGTLFTVTALNPKSIVFFMAFLSQFITPASDVSLQIVILGGTFLTLAALNAALYASFSGYLREKIQNKEIYRWLNRCGGTVLIAAGILAVAIHRSI